MQKALAVCAMAINPVPTTPAAGMVKVEGGFMFAYGGTFCVKTPVDLEIGAAFLPGPMLSFFRKERKGVTFTLKDGKIIVQEGREKLTTQYLPPEDMPTLDVLAKAVKCTLDKNLLREATSLVDAASFKAFAQGVSFIEGYMYATNSAIILSAVSGLDDEIEPFNLPLATCEALLKAKASVVSVARDRHAVKFNLADGTSITSNILMELIPLTFFEIFKRDFQRLGMTAEAAADLRGIDCDVLLFSEGNVSYTTEDKRASGTLEGVVSKKLPRCAMRKKFFDLVTRNTHELSFETTAGASFQTTRDDCRVLIANLLA